MKLLVVFGTRPEVIKLAPLIDEARRHADAIELTVCSTGQHREMLDQAMAVFGLRADAELKVMQERQGLAGLTARLLQGLDEVMAAHRPDVMVVQGDTTSAFAAGLAAFYRQIPVAHVEAGLRTGDLASPFPEELNRVLLGRLARWHFAPTPRAAQALRDEGVAPERCVVTGNTVVDAIRLIRERWAQAGGAGDEQPFAGRELVLVTAHRRENQGQALRNICAAVRQLCLQYPDLGFVFPVHLNPQVRDIVFAELGRDIPNLRLCDPVDFETNLRLQSRCRLIVTDSGGIQEEAPSFGVPVVVTREHTERSEGIEAGFATLAGTSTEAIVRAARTWLDQGDARRALASRPNPYGDGHAARRMVELLLGDPELRRGHAA